MDSSNYQGFYLILGSLVAASVGGAYLMYKNITQKDEEETFKVIENINPEVIKSVDFQSESSQKLESENIVSEFSENKTIDHLTVERATQIYAEISKSLDEYTELYDSHYMKQERRQAEQMNYELWVNFVSRLLRTKHIYFEEQKKKALEKYSINPLEFEKIINEKIILSNLEKELFKIYKPKFEDSELPSKSKVKQAYIFHCETMLESLKSLDNKNSSIAEPENKTFFMLMERVRIDDELYFKYGLTFNQVKYLINYYDLYSDSEVREWYNVIPS
jgi:hypothetical protein